MRGELTTMLDQRDSDFEQGWHKLSPEEQGWRNATPEKHALNTSELSGAPTPPAYARPVSAHGSIASETRPGTAFSYASSGWGQHSGASGNENSIIAGLAKTGDGRKALINMLQSQMRSDVSSARPSTCGTAM